MKGREAVWWWEIQDGLMRSAGLGIKDREVSDGSRIQVLGIMNVDPEASLGTIEGLKADCKQALRAKVLSRCSHGVLQ